VLAGLTLALVLHAVALHALTFVLHALTVHAFVVRAFAVLALAVHSFAVCLLAPLGLFAPAAFILAVCPRGQGGCKSQQDGSGCDPSSHYVLLECALC
jgi:hypothetical protein